MPVTSPPTDGDLATLRASIEADLPAFLADLKHLVNIDCGSYVPAGVDEVGRWTGEFMESIGARVEYRPDPDGQLGSTVVGTFEGRAGGPRVLLIGHMDTVFEPGTPSARPFASGRQHRDRSGGNGHEGRASRRAVRAARDRRACRSNA